MSPTHPSDDANKKTNGQVLLDRIASLGVRPFASQVVQSPWNTVVDVPELHRQVKDCILDLVAGCGQIDAIRCLTVVSTSGYGKTHLLAWTRQLLDERKDSLFVYVSPYNPGSVGGVTVEQHVMRATLEALWSRSVRQKSGFEHAVRSFLVGCYDRVIDAGSVRDIRETLRVGSLWERLFQRTRLSIAKRGVQSQLAALQRAFTRRQFFEEAFAEFCRTHPVGPDGVRPDWDAFVASCLQTCGDARQRWHAERWFRADRIPPDVFQPFHLDNPCHGAEKVRNGLFTLQRIVGHLFCLAFDQLEDTFQLADPTSKEAGKFTELLGILLRNLSVMPGFCLLFCCQNYVWHDLLRRVPSMLIDRMTEGYGAQVLKPLDDTTAQELVKVRMTAAVWSRLADVERPPDLPCFPFTADEVRKMRIDAGSELRGCLQRAQEEFEKRLDSRCPRTLPLRIQLTEVEPREVVSHETSAVLICGKNLPADVRVLFNGQPVEMPPVCRPATGEIDVTTPAGLVGDVEVRVEAADDPNNSDSVQLHFMQRPVPLPYCEHIDPQKLKDRRRELGLTQKQAGDWVGKKPWEIGKLERAEWKDAPDELYARLAQVYEAPLSSFLKNQA